MLEDQIREKARRLINPDDPRDISISIMRAYPSDKDPFPEIVMVDGEIWDLQPGGYADPDRDTVYYHRRP